MRSYLRLLQLCYVSHVLFSLCDRTGCLKTERSSMFVFGECEGDKLPRMVAASEGNEDGLTS